MSRRREIREFLGEAPPRSRQAVYSVTVRLKAIEALGGKCPCGEADPEKLRIIVKGNDEVSRSTISLYNRIRMFKDAHTWAKLKCQTCRNAETAIKKMGGLKGEDNQKAHGTGCFYWIGGKKVEEWNRKTKVVSDEKFGECYIVKVPLYDLGTSPEEVD